MNFNTNNFQGLPNFNFAVDSLFVARNSDQGGAFPPVIGYFLLLDGTPFLLLDGENLELL